MAVTRFTKVEKRGEFRWFCALRFCALAVSRREARRILDDSVPWDGRDEIHESREARRILDDSVPWDGRDEIHESREERRILDDSVPWAVTRFTKVEKRGEF